MSSDALTMPRVPSALLAFLCLSWSAAALAQDGQVDIPPMDPGPQPVAPAGVSPIPHESIPGVVPVFGPNLSGGAGTLSAADAARAIEAGNAFCAVLPPEYRVDCMAEQLEKVARALPRGAETGETREVLLRAAKDIRQVVNSNRDRSKPRVSVRTPGPNPVGTSRPLTPVRIETLAATSEEAAVILEEAGALLLRSEARSDVGSEATRSIAEALDSSALLLRS